MIKRCQHQSSKGKKLFNFANKITINQLLYCILRVLAPVAEIFIPLVEEWCSIIKDAGEKR